jgi:hypothetical protein
MYDPCRGQQTPNSFLLLVFIVAATAVVVLLTWLCT